MKVLFIALLLGMVTPGRADVIREINEARAEGCGGHAGAKTPLRASAMLGRAAQYLQSGRNLREAMDLAGYHGIKSSSVHMSGWLTDGAVARIFSRNFCGPLSDPQMAEIGFYRKNRDIWFVLAQPFSSLSLKNATAVNLRVLELTNAARSQARRCGRESFAAASPLRFSVPLSHAAFAHSRDMAKHDYFEHEGYDGSSPAQRVTEQGYRWRVTGENLAAGVTTPEEAVQGWLRSPHHCANLMDPRFTQMGAGFAIEPASKMGVYWTQVFALPR